MNADGDVLNQVAQRPRTFLSNRKPHKQSSRSEPKDGLFARPLSTWNSALDVERTLAIHEVALNEVFKDIKQMSSLFFLRCPTSMSRSMACIGQYIKQLMLCISNPATVFQAHEFSVKWQGSIDAKPFHRSI